MALAVVVSSGALKLLIEDVFGVDVARYEALFFDETFWRALAEELGLAREVTKLERTPDRIVRHVRCEPHKQHEAFEKTRAGYVEELDYDTRAKQGKWRTIPNVFTDRVRTEGTIEFVAVAGGCKRIVRGEIDVRRAFGFGRIIEKMIVGEIEKSYLKSTAFTRDWLAR